MTFADFASAHRPISTPVGGFSRAVAKWIAARRAERSQQATLQSLLFAPEHRLRDLGISREELIRVMQIHRK